MAAQMSVMDSAYIKSEFAMDAGDIPLTILMKKYGLSEDAQISIMNGLSQLPYLIASPSVNYGRAKIVEAYWVVEICFERRFHFLFFHELESKASAIFTRYFEQAMPADTMFQLFKTEANWLRISKIWTNAQAELWALIKKTSISHNLGILSSPTVDEISNIMRGL